MYHCLRKTNFSVGYQIQIKIANYLAAEGSFQGTVREKLVEEARATT